MGLGLGRVQQRFNAAVATILTLAGLSRMGGQGAAKEAAKGHGHPLHRKYLRPQRREEGQLGFPDTSIRAHSGNRCQHHRRVA